MRDPDLAMLERNKNVSEAVRSAVRGLITKKKMGKG
jgi:Arc/MetJ-type ribon-helix-helix transcriptional regulator